MIFTFSDFVFDSDKKILKQDGVVVSLKDKPAQLLAMFLTESKKVHSKEDILNCVWLDRVVTDQVVFQNINSLRGMFGNDAIKTFSKRGYQWQLPLSVASDESAHSEEEVLGKSTRVNKAKLWLVTLVVFTLLITFVYQSQTQNKGQSQSDPSVRNLIILATHSLIDTLPNDQFRGQLQLDPVVNQALFDSPYSTWQEHAKNDRDWLVALKTYSLESSGVLRFHIQGLHRGWEGFIHGKSVEERNAQLLDLISVITSSQYFSLKSNHSALAQLALLSDANAGNVSIQYQLIKQNLALGYLDRASALAKKQIAGASHAFYLGVFHLLNAEISMKNDNWEEGSISTQKALTIFAELDLPQLMSLAKVREAWSYFYNKNNRAALESVNASISFARIAKEPMQEVNAHLIQSFLASKMDLSELMYTQISLATKLIELHKLSTEHLVATRYFAAWGATDNDEKLKLYQSVLSSPFSILYADFFYQAAEYVRDTSLALSKTKLAEMSIKTWQRPSFVAITEALIAFEKNDFSLANKKGIEAFQMAEVNQILEDSLDAALLIIRINSTQFDEGTSNKYLDYLRQNATHRWLRQNSLSLRKLGILNSVAPIKGATI